MSAKIG